MAKDTFLNRKVTLNSKGMSIDLSRPAVMAILNLTPDSFYKDSRITGIDEALKRTENFLSAGAKFIDIGAYSSRPGAIHISEDEELARLIPVVEALSRQFPEAWLSIDTFRSGVAENAVHAGAHIVNDISAGNLDEMMFDIVAKLNVPYIMMHLKGNPQNMQENPVYENITTEVHRYFADKIKTAQQKGEREHALRFTTLK